MAKKSAKPKRKPDPDPVPASDVGLFAESKQYGAILSLAKPCPFCKHDYIKPCTDKTKDACPNFQHLKGQGKKK
jgi:hypothetical protein